MVATQPKLRSQSAQETIDRLGQAITGFVSDLEAEMLQGHSAHFLEALEWWASFHHYSFANAWLIRHQYPNAIQVAGIKKWNSLGYTIKAGSKGIAVRAPWLVNEVDESTGEITGKRMAGHFPVYVYDVQQTNEYAEKGVPSEFQPPYGPDDFQEIFDRCVKGLNSYAIPVEYKSMGRAYGATNGKKIYLNKNHGVDQHLASLVHEAAHILGEHKPGQRQDQELVAEAVTYVICRSYGINHLAARDYLVNYKVKPEQLKENLDEISRLAKLTLGVFQGPSEVKRDTGVETDRNRDNAGGSAIPETCQPPNGTAGDFVRLRNVAQDQGGRIPAFRAADI